LRSRVEAARAAAARLAETEAALTDAERRIDTLRKAFR
jgi:hypothetical protein